MIRLIDMDENIKVTKCRSGVDCIVIDMPHLNSVVVDVFVKMGSMYEEPKEAGMAHFLEHMAFKGTKKRKSSYDINKEIDSQGGQIGASTSFELTNYRIKTIPSKIKWAIEMLSDLVINSTIPKTEIAREKGVVIEEIKMYKDNPTMSVSLDFIDLFYGASDRGCWNISGEQSDVTNFKQMDLFYYRKKQMIDENVIVVLSGNVSGDKGRDKAVVDYVDKSFGGLKSGTSRDYKWGQDYILGDKKKKTKIKKLEQAHFCLGFPTVGRLDRHRYAFKLIDIMLAGNMSSRLFNRLREDLGWAYYIYPESHQFSDFGFSGIQSGVKIEKLNKAVDLVTNEFCQMIKTVTKEEIEAAKNYWLAVNKLSMDSPKFWARFIGQSYLLDKKLLSLNEEMDKMLLVDVDEVKSVIGAYFKEDKRRLMVIK